MIEHIVYLKQAVYASDVMRLDLKCDDSCERCGSSYRADFGTEVCIHVPGIENLTSPHEFVFPKLAICLECGSVAGFRIPDEQLGRLREHVKKPRNSHQDTAQD